MDVQILREGDVNCPHSYILYMAFLEDQRSLCDFCGRYAIIEPIVFDAQRGGTWLPPNAFVRTTLPFYSHEIYTHKTDEKGYINGPLPEEEWKSIKDITQRFNS